MPKPITIDPEKIVEIRNALQVIQFNNQRELSYIKMSKNITEQVKRIDKLLPQVRFENNEEPCPICHGAGATTDHHDPCTECDGSGNVGGD